MRRKSISGAKYDLLANIAGVSWTAVAQIVCVPIYIRLLGIDAFGLVGFYLVLQSLLQVLDFGLSPTINREMARYSVQPKKAAEARDLVRTLEVGYWAVGIAIGTAIAVATPSIATHWIKAGDFPIRTIRQAVMIMGILAFVQWPISFYQGGLMGAGRQVLFNTLKISQSTLANGGAVLILWFFSPTILAFFLWQAAVNAVQVVLVAMFLWKSLPSADRSPRFDLGLARGIWRFAAGMSGITICALILTQADKMIVSKLFSLRVFGYYTVAGMFGTGLTMIIGAVFNTVYPRFSSLVAAGQEEALKRLYHRCTQMTAVIILPLGAVLAVFSEDILRLWTRNSEIAHNAGPIATLLVIGTALNGLMNLPYALQLAYGWTSIGVKISGFLSILVVPAIWFMAKHWGPVGAASGWVVLNCIYISIGAPLTHRRLLRGEAWRWLADIGLPFVPVLFIAFIGKGLLAASTSAPVTVLVLSLLLFCGMGAAALVSPLIRPLLVNQLLRAEN
jgi:O-antigen/teichoic acid export membrane protein